MTGRDVCITGYGLISPLGDSPDEWWAALNDRAIQKAQVDAESCAPFVIHTVSDFDLSSQVPRPGDQRAMGPMMQFGVYAAGRALEMAGLKDNEDLLLQTHMIVASGGGERDLELDRQIVEGAPGRNDQDEWITAQMTDGLRPTLFLAQLPNLFAGNVSIVHKVSGSSRTFMGEESAGADALRIACRRLAAGQGDIFLVGAGFASDRPDLQISYNAGGHLLRDGFQDLWGRPDAGMAFGGAGAFLVLESRDSAASRGVDVRAVIQGVESDRTNRSTTSPADTAHRQAAALAVESAGDNLLVLSGASGAGGQGGVTSTEQEWLTSWAAKIPVRGIAQAVGHAVEASFLQNVIIAALCVEKGEVFAPLSDASIEQAPGGPVSKALVTGWGHLRGEAMALVAKG